MPHVTQRPGSCKTIIVEEDLCTPTQGHAGASVKSPATGEKPPARSKRALLRELLAQQSLLTQLLGIKKRKIAEKSFVFEGASHAFTTHVFIGVHVCVCSIVTSCHYCMSMR